MIHCPCKFRFYRKETTKVAGLFHQSEIPDFRTKSFNCEKWVPHNMYCSHTYGKTLTLNLNPFCIFPFLKHLLVQISPLINLVCSANLALSLLTILSDLTNTYFESLNDFASLLLLSSPGMVCYQSLCFSCWQQSSTLSNHSCVLETDRRTGGS